MEAEKLVKDLEKILRELKMERKKLKIFHKRRILKRKRRKKGFREIPPHKRSTLPPPYTGTYHGRYHIPIKEAFVMMEKEPLKWCHLYPTGYAYPNGRFRECYDVLADAGP